MKKLLALVLSSPCVPFFPHFSEAEDVDIPRERRCGLSERPLWTSSVVVECNSIPTYGFSAYTQKFKPAIEFSSEGNRASLYEMTLLIQTTPGTHQRCAFQSDQTRCDDKVRLDFIQNGSTQLYRLYFFKSGSLLARFMPDTDSGKALEIRDNSQIDGPFILKKGSFQFLGYCRQTFTGETNNGDILEGPYAMQPNGKSGFIGHCSYTSAKDGSVLTGERVFLDKNTIGFSGLCLKKDFQGNLFHGMYGKRENGSYGFVGSGTRTTPAGVVHSVDFTLMHP